MALSRVGGSSAAATSIAIPAHVAGDLIVIWAYRDGNTTPPTIPAAGGTVPTFTAIDNPTGANSNSAVCAWAVAAGTTDTSGTWTNATGMSVEVWRGASSAPIGGHAQSGGSVGSGGNLAVPAITLTDPTGASIILEFAGWQTVTAWSAAPTGYTQQSNVATECEALSKNTTTSDGAVNVSGTASGTGGYRTEQIEILADQGNRVSQEAIEVLNTGGTSSARVSQEAVEVLNTGGTSSARISQEAIEVLNAPPTVSNRLSQVAIEVLLRLPVRPDFIASVTAVYTPALQAYVSVPFISSTTTLYAINFQVDVPFIASSTAVYTPTLQGYVEVPFISSATALYTPDLTHASAEVDVPFISSVTAVYAPDLQGYVTVPFIASVTTVYALAPSHVEVEVPSAVVLLAADAPVVYPIQLLFSDQSGEIIIASAGAEVSHVQTLTSGVIALKADVPTTTPISVGSGVIELAADPLGVAGVVTPPSGILRLKADPPLPVGAVKPPSGVVKLTSAAATVFPYQPIGGRVQLKASAPAHIYPLKTAGGRVIVAGGSPPYTTPTKIPSGVLLLKANSPTIAHVSIILQVSGIIRLRSDVPVVTPLTEPPPEPPPLEGTGIRMSGTVG